jgi:hypothetical protein
MKKVEKKTKTAEIEVTITTVICDMCKEEVDLDGELDAYEQEISSYMGEYIPDEGDTVGTEYSVDLCEGCMKTVLFEIFPKYGINVNDE